MCYGEDVSVSSNEGDGSISAADRRRWRGCHIRGACGEKTGGVVFYVEDFFSVRNEGDGGISAAYATAALGTTMNR